MKTTGCNVSISDNLRKLIIDKYNQARKTKNLHYIENGTLLRTDPQSSMNYWIRYAPSLQLKPERGDTLDIEDPLSKYEPELLVLDTLDLILSRYKLILNKFPVMPYHSLLVTKAHQNQYDMLNQYDLNLSIQMIKQLNNSTLNNCSPDWEDKRSRFVIIFNSGPYSGSSLSHKHLQLLELPQGFVPFQDALVDNASVKGNDSKETPLQDEKKGFAHFVLPIDGSKLFDTNYLYKHYLNLYENIQSFFTEKQINSLQERSYNLILTENWICLVPRRRIKATSLNIGFNSIAFLGLIMVKDDSVFVNLKKNCRLLSNCLIECGFPRYEL